MWNLRLELGHQLHPAPLRTTEFAEAHASSPQVTKSPMPVLPSSGTPSVVRTARMGCLPGSEFPLQADGTLRCPAGHPLFEQERRQERDDTLRIVYAASIGHCRPCPLRERCQGYGAATSKPRRVSAILRLSAEPTRSQEVRAPKTGTAPVLWRDWSRCQTRREWMRLLRRKPCRSPGGSRACGFSPEGAQAPLPRTARPLADVVAGTPGPQCSGSNCPGCDHLAVWSASCFCRISGPRHGLTAQTPGAACSFSRSGCSHRASRRVFFSHPFPLPTTSRFTFRSLTSVCLCFPVTRRGRTPYSCSLAGSFSALSPSRCAIRGQVDD